MSLATIATALTVSLSPASDIATDKIFQAQAAPQTQPFVSLQSAMPRARDGDYITTPQNCTYRRTKAPGYPEMWVLVLNPHHIGRPNSPTRCKGVM